MLAAAVALLAIAAAGCSETRAPQEQIPQAEGSGRKVTVRLKTPSTGTSSTVANTIATTRPVTR